MSDATAGRPELSNYDRDIPAALARVAVFIIPIGREPYDGRELHEKLVAGCEGASCVLPTREATNGEAV